MGKLLKMVRFRKNHDNCGGTLVQYQPGEDEFNCLPFEIRKVLYMTDIKPGDVRGNHAHHETAEVLFALTGACTVEVDDGRGNSEVCRLSDPSQGVLLLPDLWRVVRNFEKNTSLLAIADRTYDEADYIRSYEDFKSGLEG